MNNNTRNEMVKARNGLQKAIEAFIDLSHAYHNGLRGEMKDDFANMADDLQRNELRQLVLTAQGMGEPEYTTRNTSCTFDVGSGEYVLWYHHHHPDTGELIYHRLATMYPTGRFAVSDEDPAITSQAAYELINQHQEEM